MERFYAILNAVIWVSIACALALIGSYLTQSYRKRNEAHTDDDVLSNLQNLKESGVLSDDEFRAARSTMLQNTKAETKSRGG